MVLGRTVSGLATSGDTEVFEFLYISSEMLQSEIDKKLPEQKMFEYLNVILQTLRKLGSK